MDGNPLNAAGAARRVRLIDVATAAGTSAPIASRVLNGDATLSIGNELRERIERAARDLGYRPHAAARRLRTAEAGAIGMVVPQLTNPAFARMFRGASRAARASDIQVFLAEDNDDVGPLIGDLVQAGRIDGLIVASGRADLPIDRFQIPHIFLNRAVAGSGRNVTMDDGAGTRLAVDHLVDLGHRRLAHITGSTEADNATRRGVAFDDQTKRRRVERAITVAGDITELGGAASARRVLDESPGTTAIFAGSPAQATGAIFVAWERGLRVPEDLSIIGFSDIAGAEVTIPPLTTVSMPLEELGEIGLAELLLQRAPGVIRDVVIPTQPEVIQRRSTGPAPG